MAFTLPTPSANASSVVADFRENSNDLTDAPAVAQQSRWDWAEIDEELWSSSFPYQLVVLQAALPATSVDPDSPPTTSYGVYQGLTFTLPINPEEMSKSMAFASTLTATLDGVVEQNGGVPFRDFNMSGTFGILPTRANSDQLTDGVLNQIEGVFGGTIQGAQQTFSTASAAVAGITYTPNVMKESDIEDQTTGYYQYRKFERFLESYAEVKRTDSGKSLRLALVIWKEQAAYIVTPREFRTVRTKDSPFEYRFQLMLRAWKRINSKSIGLSAVDNTPSITPPRNAAWAQKILQRIDLARKTLSDANNTINAISGDLDQTVGQALRQVGLFLKDAVGLAKTVNDLPGTFKTLVGQNWASNITILQNLGQDFKGGRVTGTGGLQDGQSKSTALPGGGTLAAAGSDPTAMRAMTKLQARIIQVQRDPSAASRGDPIGLSALLNDPANQWLGDALNPDTMSLNPTARGVLNDEVKKARSLTSDDIRTAQNKVYGFMAGYADKVGLGSVSYSISLNLTPQQQVRDPTDDDYNIIASLADAASALGSVAAFGGSFQQRVPSTIEYVAGIANAAGIAMRVPRSKFAVPFPYQGSLERLAQQYLGDSQRWFEIAALNDLREPYIDEAGSAQALLVQSKDNEFVVPDASSVVLGQSVTLTSNDGLTTIQAQVMAAQKLAPSYWVVTIDQPTNLPYTGGYGQAQWFNVNTVRGGQVLYIPSDQPSQLENSIYSPSLADLQRMLQVGDVDGMLTEQGDIDFQPDGEWPFVYGLQNIIQWARTACSTPRGSMVLHPSWGFPVEVGQIISDTSADDILKALQMMFDNGPAFVAVRSAVVSVQPPTAQVSFELQVRGSDALIPITFNLSR